MGSILAPSFFLLTFLFGEITGYVVFEDGYDYCYTYSADSDIIGRHNISTIIKIRIRHVNKTGDSDLNQLIVDSFFQRSQDGFAANNPLKWRLHRPFLFERNKLGEITGVHFHEDDEHELVNLKKALSGIFSLHVKPDLENVWSYNVNETDHSGTKEHKYFAHRQDDNSLTLKRYHHSVKQIERRHSQVVHITPSKDMQSVDASDHVIIKNKFNEQAERRPEAGETPIRHTSSGDIPVIQSKSTVKVVLESKRFHGETTSHHWGLKVDSVVSIPPPPSRVPLKNVSAEIDVAFNCIEKHTNKYAPNRTECVNTLKSHLTKLDPKDLLSVAEGFLNATCTNGDETCFDKRFLVIDMLCQIATPEAQGLVVKILESDDAHKEETRRILFHFVGLKNPVQGTVDAVHNMCVGKNKQNHGKHNHTSQTHRACLTLGALARTLSAANETRAEEIVDDLSSWLGSHDGNKMEHGRHRIKREIPPGNETHEKYRLSKMILIEALGNTGHPKALGHIISYTRANMGHSAWRRSGVNALRWFTCKRSAQVLMDTAMNDDYDTVREKAYRLYKKHPQRKNMTTEEVNMVFSHKYTYPVVMKARSRRGLAHLMELLSFKLELPGIDWVKTIGSSAIGASFGIIIRNKMELELKPLSGFFEIDIYNTAFVIGEIGYVDKQVEFFKALACYQGFIRYDLNVLKDFGINDISDLANLFDKMIGSIRDPIEDAVAAFNKIITLFKGKGLKGIIKDFVTIIQELPKRLKHLVENIIKFAKQVSDYGRLPWVKAIKKVIYRIKHFIEDVKGDIMDFYNSIVDAITVTLPYVGRRIIDAIKMIVHAVRTLMKNPMQSISSIMDAVMNIKMAISMVIGAKQKIEENCFFLWGELPYWMNPGAELKYLVEDIKDAIAEVGKFLKRLAVNKNRNRTPINLRIGPEDGILSQEEQERKIAEEFVKMLRDTLSPVNEMLQLARPFMDAYNSVFDTIRGVKKTYLQLTSVVQKSRALVQKIFGPKFHIDFPTYRVDCEESVCACGTFPSVVNGNFPKGVDVRANQHAKVVNPTTGLVKKRNNNEVLIIPSEGDFFEYEIVISNIEPSGKVTSEGKVFQAGEKIGKVAKSQCKPSFIHVAVRKKAEADEEFSKDDDYAYIDPLPFLERAFPVPRWIEDCKEFSLVYIGQTADAGEIGDDVQETIDDVKRKYEDRMENPEFELSEPDPDLTYRPPGMAEGSSKSLQQSFQGALDKFKDVKSLFNVNSGAPNILDKLNVNEFSMRRILDILIKGAEADIKARLDDIINKYSVYLRAQPVQHPITFSPHELRSMLRRKNIEPRGSLEQMALQYIRYPAGVCPQIVSGLGQGNGMFCQIHKDCRGVTCGVVFALHFFQKVTKLDIRYNVCANEVQLKFGSFEQSFSLTTGENFFKFQAGEFAEMFGLGRLSLIPGPDHVVIFLDARLCSPYYPTCTQAMNIFDGVVFTGNPSDACRSGPENDLTYDQVMSMTLDAFAYYVLDANVAETADVLRFLNEIRVAALDAIMKNRDFLKEITGSAFPSKIDFCMDGDIPIPPLDITFFEYSVFFMVGPIPMRFAIGAGGSMGIRLTVGACFLSMTGFVEVTPYLGAKVYGSLALDIGFAAGGIELVGYLLETKFPIKATVKFNKFPLDVGITMRVELVPVRLQLKAFVLLRLLFFNKKWSYKIWEWAAPTIKGEILNKPIIEDDKSPPELTSTAVSKRKRSLGKGCSVIQVPGRDPENPAFLLEVTATDEVSDIKRRYSVGSHKGGNDILDWTEMGGVSVTVPIVLEHGIPLFWTVKIRNSQRLEATAECSLNTYDMTVPSGKVEESFAYTSHPHKLSASLILHDDSPLVANQLKAVGVGEGAFGNTVSDWEVFKPSVVTENKDGSGDLKYFAFPRRGRLTSDPFKTTTAFSDSHCAAECLRNSAKCLSFDYNSQSEDCYLQRSIDSQHTRVKQSGAFFHYQRLIGHTSLIEYDSLPLSHSEVYFVNVHITNVLGYESFLSSSGTIVDFTPPEPGFIMNASLDIIKHDGCNAAVTQRCKDVTWNPNHRVIVDGSGSRTVLNGHEHGTDLKFTLTNNYISANWDGFKDHETDIWGYTWAAGTSVCGTDVSPYDDPHKHLSGKSYWTHHGLTSDLHLQDGPYFASVQAINSVVLGGALVTTVCHSTPIIVDTTKPEVHSIGDYIYDEDFDILLLYYNVSDSLSGIKRVDFGLGHTKYDVNVRSYSSYAHIAREEPYIAIEQLGLQDGVPAWIRLRAVDNVMLFAASHSDVPLLKDSTPPEEGEVFDGLSLHADIDYQSDKTLLCAHWKDFYDPDTGINEFYVIFNEAVNNTVMGNAKVSHLTKKWCFRGDLQHNNTYYTTVVAVNRGLRPKTVNVSSNGVLIDVTPPTEGWVKDGKKAGMDLNFTHKQSEITAHFGNFTDPESGVAEYNVNVIVNGKARDSFDNGLSTKFEEHSLALDNGDNVVIEVHSKNGAGSITTVSSDGYTVDLTPPVMTLLMDSENGQRYQTRNDSVYAKWKFEDLQSGIAEYRLTVFMYFHGSKMVAWPIQGREEVIQPLNEYATMNISRPINLVNGAKYTVQVTAINHAQLSTTHESDGIRVDTSPPKMTMVTIGLSADDEVLDENGQVMQLEKESILASWHGFDEHSGILSYLVGVGTKVGDVSISNGFVDFGESTHGHITGLKLLVSNVYYVTVKCKNGAGLMSKTKVSKPIFVLKENVPGIIFDGRDEENDYNFQRDSMSLAIHFHGFESEACGIVTYEWAIGTQPGFSDVESFSSYGIVMLNESHGIAESNIGLENGVIYYATVRAVTGHNCHEEFIVSVSDGVLVDNSAPQITFTAIGGQSIEVDGVHYQQNYDSLSYSWNSTDGESGVAQQQWHYGSLPGMMNVHNLSMSPDSIVPTGALSLDNSLSGFLTVETIDHAGNKAVKTSAPLTIDATIPEIFDFSCSQYVSSAKPQVECKWTVRESESRLQSVYLGLGNKEGSDDILPFVSVSTARNKGVLHMKPVATDKSQLVYATLNVTNKLRKYAWLSNKIRIEETAPEVGSVRIVNENKEEVSCQVSQTDIAVYITGFFDDQSGLERFDVSVGTAPNGVDLRPFKSVGLKDFVRLDRLVLSAGTNVYVTVKAFNTVGMYSQVTSNPVVISPSSHLVVKDGIVGDEVDYQTSLSSVTANWHIKHGCKVQSLEWAVYRIDGAVIKPMESVLDPVEVLTDDELDLENMKSYFVVVHVIDTLGRKHVAKSNGFAVSIEPPEPGAVMDGKDGDIEYQQSANTIYAQWSDFGKIGSHSPSQIIVKYEVALGDDVGSHSSRTNVHTFVDVGLNRSFTFRNVSLVSKHVKYYITVRAHSAAGSSVIASSNGISVGFVDTFKVGKVTVDKAQSSLNFVKASWSDFETELPLLHYEVGISSREPRLPTDCDDLSSSSFDILPFLNVKSDTLVTMGNLSLEHGKSYYITVRATDVAKNHACVASTPVIIDVTKPVAGDVLIGKRTPDDTMYVDSMDSLHVEWSGFRDTESNISYFDVSLFAQISCEARVFDETKLSLLYPDVRVTGDNKTTFEKLSLRLFTPYYVKLVATNGAGLRRNVWSLPIMVDSSRPVGGSVKYGADWKKSATYQASPTSIQVMVALDHNVNSTECRTEEQLLLVKDQKISQNITVLENEDMHNGLYAFYDSANIAVNGNGLDLIIKTVEGKNVLSLPGFEHPTHIFQGHYKTSFKAAHGTEVFTSFYISENSDFSGFQDFVVESVDDEPNESDYVRPNVSWSRINTSSEAANITDKINTTVPTPHVNQNESAKASKIAWSEPAIGIHVMGFDKDGTHFVRFWAVGDDNNIKEQWVSLNFNPTRSMAEYIIIIEEDESAVLDTWNSKLYIAKEEKAILYGVKKPVFANVGCRVWNRNDHVPASLNSRAMVENLYLALRRDSACMFGDAFFDKESKIKEVWMGVGSEENGNTDILPLSLVLSPCSNCEGECDINCDTSCSVEGFVVYNVSLNNMSLSSGHVRSLPPGDQTGEESTREYFDLNIYHVVVKVVNFAAHSTTVVGKGIKIDTTAPDCAQVLCIDPVHSITEPSQYLGSGKAVGAFWDCQEHESRIKTYLVSFGTNPGTGDIVEQKDLGLVKEIVMHEREFVKPINHGQTYWFNVEAVNLAGLSSRISCNITADFEPPVITDVVVEFPNTKESPNLPPGVRMTESAVSTGIGWKLTSTSTSFYEWEIGTEVGKEDVLPRVLAGVQGSTGVEISEGTLHYKGTLENTSLSMLSRDNSTDFDESDSFYKMEPGRCTYQTLYALSRAKIKVPVTTEEVCFARKEDSVLMLDNNKTTTLTLSSGLNSTTDVEINISGSSSIIVRKLKVDDIKSRYGSAASTTFRQYIEDPSSSLDEDRVSRRLRHRYEKYGGESFFITPVNDFASINRPIELTIPFKPELLGPGQIPVVMFYDPDEDKWNELCESCNACDDLETGKDIDWVKRVVHGQVCNTRHADLKRSIRSRRDTSHNGTKNAMFPISSTQYSLTYSNKEMGAPKACEWLSCREVSRNAKELVLCNADSDRNQTQHDVQNKVTFACFWRANTLTAVTLLFEHNSTDGDFERLFLHQNDTATMMSNPHCYDDGNARQMSLTIGKTSELRRCDLTSISVPPESITFYLGRNLGLLTGKDAKFVVDCASDRCSGQVPDYKLAAAKPIVTTYIASFANRSHPVEMVSLNDLIVVVLKMTKSSIAKGITAVAMRVMSNGFESTVMANSCPVYDKNEQLSVGSDVTFSKLVEDDRDFTSASSPFHSTVLGDLEGGTIARVTFELNLRICSKPNEKFCLKTSCGMKSSDAKLLVGEYTERIPLAVLIPPDSVVNVALIASVVSTSVAVVMAVLMFFYFYKRAKSRQKVSSLNPDVSNSFELSDTLSPKQMHIRPEKLDRSWNDLKLEDLEESDRVTCEPGICQNPYMIKVKPLYLACDENEENV